MSEHWYGISKNCPGIQIRREDIKRVGDVMLTKTNGTRFARETPDIIWIRDWEGAQALRVKFAEYERRKAASALESAESTLKKVRADLSLTYEDYISRDLKSMGLM